MSDDEQKRLVETLTEGERLTLELQERARRLVGYTERSLANNRAVQDLAQHGLIQGPSAQYIIASNQALNDQTRALLQETRESFWAYGTSVAQAGSTASSSVFLNPIGMIFQPQGQVAPSTQAQAAVERYFQVAARTTSVEEARTELIRCGLDKPRGGNRSPLDLLNECVAAVEQPPRAEVSPTSVLIALRESIKRAIYDLLSRCPDQEPVKNWSDRVLSLGKRCGRVEVANGHFESLAKTITDKLVDATDGKSAMMTREQVSWVYLDGLSFLIALLRGIDERRLRP